MRDFWSVKDAGGVQKCPVRDSRLWMLQFSAKIKDLSEVTEAHGLASEGFRSDRGQNGKNLRRIDPKNSNFLSVFDLEKCYIPQKNPNKSLHSYMK